MNRILAALPVLGIFVSAHAAVVTSVVDSEDSPTATQIIEHKRDGTLRLREVRRASKEGGDIDSILLFIFFDGELRASYTRYPKESIYPSGFSTQNSDGLAIQLQTDNEFGKAKSIIIKATGRAEIVVVEGLKARLATDDEIAAFMKSSK
jgi:hypothetical protein